MNLHCTKKVLDYIKEKPVEAPDVPEFASWHANLVNFDRKNTLVLMNDLTRYTVVLYGVTKKDLKNLGSLIADAVKEAFRQEGIKESVIDAYFKYADVGNLVLAKTKGRKEVAGMTRLIEDMHFFSDRINPGKMFQTELSHSFGTMLRGKGKETIAPIDELLAALQDLTGENPVSVKAYEFKITLELRNHLVFRTISVPGHYTFRQLHEVIQESFDWDRSHLYDFTVLKGGAPAVNITPLPEEAPFMEGVSVKKDDEEILSDYMPADIRYIYDLGADWHHTLTFENSVDDFPYNHARCTDGAGDAPPDEIEGEPGYDLYAEAVNDPDHPEHVRMSRKRGFHKEFNMNNLNVRLKSL